MTIGTKSVLYGVHCLFIHPWFVALAWWKLYGFPIDPRLWVAFFVHDLGYIGKPNMDGKEGESHPELGAKIMHFLFGREWGAFTLLHSRFYSRHFNSAPSRLCYADKLATCLTPRWLYLFLANLTGEVHEYIALAVEAQKGNGKYGGEWYLTEGEYLSQKEWHQSMIRYMFQWVEDHKGKA